MVNCIDIGTSEKPGPADTLDTGVTDTNAEGPSDTGESGADTTDMDGNSDADADADASEPTRADASDATDQPDASDAADAQDAQDAGSQIDPGGDCTSEDTSACVALANTRVAGCVLGSCIFECQDGYLDVNGDIGDSGSDGCEYACALTNGGVEICDGLDNNCDGQVDEGFADLGDACTVGLGQCQRSGNIVCSADGAQTECSVKPGLPTTETCNGLDDDCDGVIDNNLLQNYYRDADGDGYGDESSGPVACDFANGVTITRGGDCDDTNSAVNPGAPACGPNPGTHQPAIDYNCSGRTLCEEFACKWGPEALCLTDDGDDGRCGVGSTCQKLADGECRNDTDCRFGNYCACLNPGPSVCCPDGQICLCGEPQ